MADPSSTGFTDFTLHLIGGVVLESHKQQPIAVILTDRQVDAMKCRLSSSAVPV